MQRTFGVTLLLLTAACAAEDDAGRVPLADVRAAQSARPPAHPQALGAEARARLDSGNAAYRRGDFAAALRDYRAAAAAAPENPAPYYGIYMVAQRLGQPALADSAQHAIARRTGEPMDSSARAAHVSATPRRQDLD